MHNQKTITSKKIFGETIVDERISTASGLKVIKTGSESLNFDTFTVITPFRGITIETVAAVFSNTKLLEQACPATANPKTTIGLEGFVFLKNLLQV